MRNEEIGEICAANNNTGDRPNSTSARKEVTLQSIKEAKYSLNSSSYNNLRSHRHKLFMLGAVNCCVHHAKYIEHSKSQNLMEMKIIYKRCVAYSKMKLEYWKEKAIQLQ